MDNRAQQYVVIRWRNHSQKDGIVEGAPSSMLIAACNRNVGSPCYAEFQSDDGVWVIIDDWCLDLAREQGRRIELVTIAMYPAYGVLDLRRIRPEQPS